MLLQPCSALLISKRRAKTNRKIVSSYCKASYKYGFSMNILYLYAREGNKCGYYRQKAANMAGQRVVSANFWQAICSLQ